MREISKELTPNDLGLTGSHQAGMTVPKDYALLSFFPTLDASEANPRALLDVQVPQLSENFPVNFVYYNGKLHGFSTRNEYRLTGLTAVFRGLEASPGDQVTLSHNGNPTRITLTLEPAAMRPPLLDTSEEDIGSTVAPPPTDALTPATTDHPKTLTIKGWTVTRKETPRS